jgi:DnaJ-domain-containing protein 1
VADRPTPHSIAKHIEALRGQERWGVGSLSQALAGYRLSPAAPELPELRWWNVLEVSPEATIDEIKLAYRAKAKQAHPDNREGWGFYSDRQSL